MLKKLNRYTVQKTLTERKILVFTPKDMERLFGASKHAVSFFLSYHLKEGFFAKLRNGLYALESSFPPEQLIANKLYEPSYISLEYALSYYHAIPEAVYTITSVSPKATREFEVKGVLYTYTRIKKGVYTGYTAMKVGKVTVLFATPEKALADYLYLVDLGFKNLNDRLTLKVIQKKKFLHYVKLFRRDSLVRLAKRLL